MSVKRQVEFFCQKELDPPWSLSAKTDDPISCLCEGASEDKARGVVSESVPGNVRLALSQGGLANKEPFLDRSGLRAALALLLPKRPSFRTIERWCERGLPYGRDPLNGRRVYLLSQVMAWYIRSIAHGSPATEGTAQGRGLSLATPHHRSGGLQRIG